ncbi:DUF5074 domain-containing protein [uncultured Bacteroides sp.]|uniref:DUF5074 domain-containing protein n=1 Tax=uncultured Bacteroides sp. TaxID=162156 RepID=UPI00261D7B18|nr:DUF5074 domain-containing protein [uncultured Bacteroides sp.]
MKKLFYLKVFVVLLLGTLVLNSCNKWDDDIDDLKNRVSKLEDSVSALNQSLTSLQTIVSALEEGDYITSVNELDDNSGYTITFAKGGTITIKNGQNGDQVPVITVKQGEDGVYYWAQAYNGEVTFMEVDGKRMPVTGSDGITPIIGIDADGFWTVDFQDGNGPQVIKDASGNPVSAKGDTGDSFFQSVDNSAPDYVVFTLADGSTFVVPKVLGGFGFTESGTETILYTGESKRLYYSAKKMAYVEILSVPKGWTAELNTDNSYVKVSPPADLSGDSEKEGMISLIGLDNNGNTLLAARKVKVLPNFADIDGTFVVIEGNMTTENGTLVYFDKNGVAYENIYEDANGGEEIGNVVQDMYIYKDKLYLITQNGNSIGNSAGRFVVCDLKTMKKEYALPLDFSQNGVGCWPQHLVIANDKAFIQYSTSDMESYSGIRVFDLATKEIADTDIEGTGGAFTIAGATKARMVYSRGEIFAARGNSVVIIDPATDAVTHTIPLYEGDEVRQVKNVVKAADGNIYALVTGAYTGSMYSPTFVNQAKVVCIDHEGKILSEQELGDEVALPVASWSPSVQLCASFTQPKLYFVTTPEFSGNKIGVYDYSTKTMTPFLLDVDPYGYMGVHPTTEELYIGIAPYFLSTTVSVYNVNGTETTALRDYDFKKASPAGMDFYYRFTDEWINK